MSRNPYTGVRNHSSSPSSMANMEHNDPSGSKKTLKGSSAAVDTIIPDSTVKTPLENYAVLRVTNTTGGVLYLFVGKDSDTPAGAPTILDGIAIPPNYTEMIYCPETDDVKESIVCKASAIGLQVIIMKS